VGLSHFSTRQPLYATGVGHPDGWETHETQILLHDICKTPEPTTPLSQQLDRGRYDFRAADAFFKVVYLYG